MKYNVILPAVLVMYLPYIRSSPVIPHHRYNNTLLDSLYPPLSETTDVAKSVDFEASRNWTEDARDYPNPFTESDLVGRCNYPMGTIKGKRWVCDTDRIIQPQQVLALSDKIQDILSQMKCQCPKNIGCTRDIPTGRFSIGIAIVNYIEGSRTPLLKIQAFSAALRRSGWSNMKRCQDLLVIGLTTGGQAVYYSPDPRVSVLLTEGCIKDINEKTKDAFKKAAETGDWHYPLNEALDYVRNALSGGSCGSKSGLSAGQIIGIVFGVISGVAFIVFIVVLCIGFCQDWECVVGTCFGICIGCILGAIQGCINALIFDCINGILDAMGCGDCCECEPFDCLPEDSAQAGGGMEF